jgi:LysW-gamma-L-lysine carboxypeptidase
LSARSKKKPPPARALASRFDGINDPVPHACVIGEPSGWRRVTLGYKGRLLLDVTARQQMAHTAGPGTSVAEVVVDLWNRVRDHATRANRDAEKAFGQLSPSLRRFITASEGGLADTVDAQIAWRLPVDFDARAFVNQFVAETAAWLGAPPPNGPVGLVPGAATVDVSLAGDRTTMELSWRGWEPAWRGDRTNALVRSFIAGLRTVDRSAQPGFVLKTGTSDMNVVAPIWRCPIVAYGPGDSALDHTPHEHLELDEYWRAVNVLEAALRELAQQIGA